jgi:hypothetical protein
MCKEGLIHVCFILDESGSMYGSENDVVGGFNKTINEQKAIEEGECLVSYFKFSDNVKEMFVGRKLDDVKPMTVGKGFWQKNWSNNIGLSNSATVNLTLDTTLNTIVDNLVNSNLVTGDDDTFVYSPNGCTAMNDGIGTAIDRIGKWLARMPEEERPSKNLIVIMTDGEENSSREYTLTRVKEMIQHQTEKYNWTFVYMGMDITSAKCADNLGINNRSFSSKSSVDTYKNYDNISSAVKSYRMSEAKLADETMCMNLCSALSEMTNSYEAKVGIKID